MKKINLPLKILVVTIVLSLITGWFYWFQWRPSEIRKECAKVSEDKINNLTDDSQNRAIYTEKLFNSLFQACAQEHGLNN